ncbi:Di-copper centre-containing protein [Apiospora phragmitis]|uniref:Di-copper centre-containing protein n=1 Tax=Apiospora phragmitis TaxID=2905665 RepID=A0ABR1VYM8_9PEZI
MHFPLASTALLIGTALAALTLDLNNGDALAQFNILVGKAQASQAAILDANAKRTPPPLPSPPPPPQAGPKAPLGNNSTAPPSSSGRCTKEKLTVRKPWGSLSTTERKAYTDAVLCLQKLPARTPKSLVPGARTRFDDFLASHINQTQTIHYTGTFMAWHRWFTFQFEQALKNECGYKGAQPYWNWALYADDPVSSPIFDGSAFSMSGDGAPVPNKGPITLLLGNFAPVVLPPGNGGGCVQTGPFKDMVVNLGPVALPLNNGTVLTGTGLEHNPRCLKRDISAGVNKAFANDTSIMQLIVNNDNVADFQMVMQGVPGSGSIGVHGGGHYTIGGDPAGDTFTSPGDPVFYLHHGMIDLVWWVWQMVAGTNTFLNQPPSANTTLDDVIDLFYAGGGPITMRELTSIHDGPFCYTYSL